ncbi:MAG: THUMP domain-containing protein [Promethearchaeota archaeon]
MSSEQIKLSPLFNVLLIRYGEIALKSQQVRKRLLRSLMRNIKFQCQRDKVKFTRIWRDHGFVYLHPEKGHMKKAINCVKTVLGVHSISPSIFAQGEFEEIQQTALELAKDSLSKGNTFGVRARRIGKHSFSSNDIAKTAGARIIEELGESLSLKVNLSSPDKWIHINVRDKNIFVYSDSINTPWAGNPIETFTEGGVLLSRGHLSEFVSAMLLMKRGVHILPVVFSENSSKDEIIHDILKNLKQYLPIRSYYYFKLDIHNFQSRIAEISEEFNYPPLEYLLNRKFQLLLGTWFVENHKAIFEKFEDTRRIDWNSNIASYLSNKQQKSRPGKPRKLINYVSIVEGNYPFSYYSSKFPFFRNIESSHIPIFRAAVAFSSFEILEKFKNLVSLDENQTNQLLDYPEIDEPLPSSEKNYPFNPQLRDSIPNSISTNFDEFWMNITQELESLLNDLYSKDPIESLELVEI